MARKIWFLMALIVLGVLSATAGALASLSGAPNMGKPKTISQPAFRAYYDGHVDIYLSTDVSDKKQAAADHINYAPGLKLVPLTTPEIYFVKGRATVGQVAVLGSQPGEKDYTPIWRETLVTWKAGTSPVLLTSDTQISALVKKGSLTEQETSVRINCPVIKVGKG